MGSTTCYDILIKQAKNKKIKSNAEPGQEDPEFDEKVEKEKEKYQKQADTIYDVETAKIKAQMAAKKAALAASEPVKTSEYMMERFNSNDIDKYGEDGIKTTMQREMQKLSQGIDEMEAESDRKIEELKQKLDKEAKAKREKKLAEKEKKLKEKREKKKQKEEEKKNSLDKNKITKKSSPDLINEASKIGKETDQDIDMFTADQEALLEEYEKAIEKQAKENGESKGAKMVSEYNKAIEKAAKIQYELIQKNLAKAKITAKQVAQSAKLKLFAMIGV